MASATAIAAAPRAAPARRPAANRMLGWLLWFNVLVALAILIIYPMAWLGIGSFQDEAGEWTTANYAEVFSGTYLKLLWDSLVFTVLATIVALAIGVPMGWAMARTDIPCKGFFRAASAVTFVLPPLFQSMAFVFIFQPNAGLANLLLDGLIGVKPFNIFSFTGLVMVTALGVYPQSFMLVDSALRSMDPALEEAATSTGASRLAVLRRITLPLIAPTILTSMNLTAIHNLVVFGPPAVIGIPANIYVMSTQIYVELATFPPRLEFTAALSVLFLAFAVLLLFTQWTVTRRRNFATIVGKGMRPRELRLKGWRWPVFALCLLVIAIALFIPAVVLIGISLFKVWTNWLEPGNLTLIHYRKALFGDARTFVSIGNTLILAAVTVTATLAVGLAIAFIVTKTRHPMRHLLNYLSFLPYSIPGTIFTVGVILAFIRPPFVLYGTLGILMACYFARFLPFAVQPLSAALRQVDNSMLEAGRIAGAGWFPILRRILLPLLKFSVLSTIMLIFIACLREVVSAVLLAAPGTETLMVNAFRLWEEGSVQETAVLMVVLLVLVLAFFLAARSFVGEKMFN